MEKKKMNVEGLTITHALGSISFVEYEEITKEELIEALTEAADDLFRADGKSHRIDIIFSTRPDDTDSEA